MHPTYTATTGVDILFILIPGFFLNALLLIFYVRYDINLVTPCTLLRTTPRNSCHAMLFCCPSHENSRNMSVVAYYLALTESYLWNLRSCACLKLITLFIHITRHYMLPYK